VVDHRHSPADVAAGGVLGTVVAPFWLARVIARDFSRPANTAHANVHRRVLSSESLEAVGQAAPLLDSDDSDTETTQDPKATRVTSEDGL
jgi:hypothetical protein